MPTFHSTIWFSKLILMNNDVDDDNSLQSVQPIVATLHSHPHSKSNRVILIANLHNFIIKKRKLKNKFAIAIRVGRRVEKFTFLIGCVRLLFHSLSSFRINWRSILNSSESQISNLLILWIRIWESEFHKELPMKKLHVLCYYLIHFA